MWILTKSLRIVGDGGEKEVEEANKKISDALANVKDIELDFATEVKEDIIVAKLLEVDGIEYKAVLKEDNTWTITVQDAAKKGEAQSKEIQVTVAAENPVKEPEKDENKVDRRDIQVKNWQDISQVLKEELINYPNEVKLKIKVSDYRNIGQDASKKAYDEYFKENRTQYGNVSFVIKGNQPDGSFSWESEDDILDISFQIKYVHYITKKEIPAEDLRRYREEAEKVVDNFVKSEIEGKNLSDAEKVLKINDYLAKTASYNHESIKLGRYLIQDHIAYGVLVDKIGVCESYAKAFDLLAKASGLETIYVVGQATNPGSSTGEAHAWNMVKIEGEWYNIDTTWNDIGDTSSYDYFLKPDSIMEKSHKRDNDFPYPEAKGSKDFTSELKLNN